MKTFHWSFKTFLAILLALACTCFAQDNRKAFVGKSLIWRCNFDKNACHFRNQYNLARFNRYYNQVKPFYGRNSVLVLDLSSGSVQKFPGSRLISHYFPASYSNACLHITYLMFGRAPRLFYVIQQDKENKCLFVDENEKKDLNGVWRNINLQLDLTDGEPRFFIEAHYDQTLQNQHGYIAIASFSFEFGNCRKDDVNHCYSQIETADEYPVPNPV